ncbi:MAG: hypothetical protein F6K30_26270 [Cyanothece sp. SIO2G6]|nr:hypothetical protein [Cyanothece sp. SIO2G6]
MAYSQFKTIRSVKQAFDLTVVEGDRFLPELSPVEPSAILQDYLADTLPLVATSGSEKARSEGIIYPLLLEVRRQLNRSVSLFSGEDFTVDETVGLNGICDFLLTRSPDILEIEAPAVVLIEAKKTELKSGLGQCIAEMVAAQRFNQSASQATSSPITTIYGCVSNGIQWQFLQLEEMTVQIDLTVYPLPPIDRVLADMIWMAHG